MQQNHSIPKVIGVCGYEFAGKDTIARALNELFGHERVSLSDSLKELAYNLNPILKFKYKPKHKFEVISKVEYKYLRDLVDQLGWDKAKRLLPVRQFLQTLGTEGCRAVFGEDIWLEVATKRIDLLGGPVVVPDVRFPNEGHWIRGYAYGLLLWVNREGYGPVNNHPSAQGSVRTLAHYEVDNNGTFEDLKNFLLTLPPLAGILQPELEPEGEDCTGDPMTCPLYASVYCSACIRSITGD